jgi:radical SAM superfamily enzyme YgiQ (UPF0313 family)
MRVHLVNPSDNSFGTAVITPRWLFVLAAATPAIAGDPVLVDESLEQIEPETIAAGDIVGISVHTGNALRGYEVGRMARERGAWVIYGGIHATLFPEEPFDLGEAHSVVKGDGDLAWGIAVVDCMQGKLDKIYDGGRIGGSEFLAARWDLISSDIARMPETLLLLQRVAYRWTEAAAEALSERGGRDRRVAQVGIPLHRAGGRQLLSGHPDRPAAGA